MKLGMPAALERHPKASSERMRGARELVDDQPRTRLQAENRDHAVFGAKAALDVERVPGLRSSHSG